MKPYLALLALCLAASLSNAEIYKWKDAKGAWQYSDTPPAGADKGKAQIVKTSKQPVSVAPSSRAEGAKPVTTASQAAASAPAAESQSEAKKDPKLCAEARTRTGYLQSARYNSLNEKGKVEFMTEERKKEELAKMQDIIKKNCG
ncbi:hypothetical protein JHS3_10200 [Jeongeupia sp. HS-3]|uniref:DUF4124 domain-containing protein n=1 Tax=Jeongeupia sp. HS-3 TaxID=1009682 RepID=UPI0018A35C05|nr:DUF4124 domain-containing protein [Jeongeupia sp. HS-3]BCL75284.1 hypothetical protein JHS3_10200 [Jeongeupia sp. HS-3]